MNIRMQRLTTKRWSAQVLVGGVARDLTYDTLWFTAKRNLSDADGSALFQLTNGDGIDFPDAANGWYRVTIGQTRTSGSPNKRTVYYYDIKICFNTGEDYVLESGTLCIEPAITFSGFTPIAKTGAFSDTMTYLTDAMSVTLTGT